MKLRHAAVLVLIYFVILSLAGGIASGQSQLVPPAPKRSKALAVDPNGNLIEQGEKATNAPLLDAPQNALEIPQVPKDFEGCWEGTITEPVSWELACCIVALLLPDDRRSGATRWLGLANLAKHARVIVERERQDRRLI